MRKHMRCKHNGFNGPFPNIILRVLFITQLIGCTQQSVFVDSPELGCGPLSSDIIEGKWQAFEDYGRECFDCPPSPELDEDFRNGKVVKVLTISETDIDCEYYIHIRIDYSRAPNTAPFTYLDGFRYAEYIDGEYWSTSEKLTHFPVGVNYGPCGPFDNVQFELLTDDIMVGYFYSRNCTGKTEFIHKYKRIQ